MKDAIEQAKREIDEERFRDAVEREKRWLKRPWYVRAFPWRLKIRIINLKEESKNG